MAIVDMKRVSLLGLKADEADLLRAMQKMGCIQLTPAQEQDASKPMANAALFAVEEEIARVSWAIGKLGKFDKTKAPMLGGKPDIDEEQAVLVLEKQPELMKTVEALEALEREQGELRGQAARIQATFEQLAPWQTLEIPMEELKATRHTMALLGTVQKAGLEAKSANGEIPPLCFLQVVSNVRDLSCVYVLAHRGENERVQAVLKELNFTPVTLTGFEGTVAGHLAGLTAELEQISQRQAKITEEMAAYTPALAELKILSDGLCSKRDRLAGKQHFVTSQRTFFLRGWIPALLTEKAEKALQRISPTVSVEFSDPEEGDEPPVLLHNNAVVQPFETIVSGFSLPAPGGLDPTAVMMPFFVNFMGMMISDAGYGVLMALLMPLLIKLMKPSPGAKRIMWILCWGGLATIVWGALYNTWFGFAPWPSLFDPVNQALPVMAVCIALGAVHLLAGLGVAAYMNIKRGKPGSAIADQLSWVLVLAGLGLLLVKPEIGQWIALAGVAIILCTSGREKSKNPFKRLISGLGALYGITSWVSDLLSYMRLFGMGLATGVIGMVINQLVGMVFGAGVIGMVLGSVLFVGGHLFNAGINILGAYVHSCRLQYIEFFGKFYEDGGKPFMPLKSTNRYVYIKEAVERP